MAKKSAMNHYNCFIQRCEILGSLKYHTEMAMKIVLDPVENGDKIHFIICIRPTNVGHKSEKHLFFFNLIPLNFQFYLRSNANILAIIVSVKCRMIFELNFYCLPTYLVNDETRFRLIFLSLCYVYRSTFVFGNTTFISTK